MKKFKNRSDNCDPVAYGPPRSVAENCGLPDLQALPADAACSDPGSNEKRKISRRVLLRGTGVVAAMAAVQAPSDGTARAHSRSATSSDSLSRSHRAASVSGLSAEALPGLEIIALNRIAFGPRPGDLEAFLAMGDSPDDALTAYVDQQLHPESIDDSACDTILDQQNFATMDLSLADTWIAYVNKEGEENKDNDRYLPIKEVRTATFLKAVYSERQLSEVLADFWHNHFNVYGWSYWEGPTFRHYDRDVIRKHMLGNFRQMIEAVAKAPAMIFYLDNQSNEGGDPNENFSRELFELHTLGAENYYGVLDPADPSLYDDNGHPIGYVDDWVYGATTCFTGWRIDRETGLYEFDDAKHFPFQKVVLGKILPSFQGEQDGHDVLDMLATHPGTARYICRKLCRRFIADDPPESIVTAAADVFLAHVDADDQLKQVMRTILLSDEFKTTWAEKVKRPFEYTISAMRATLYDLDPITKHIYWYYDPAGQSLFGRSTPDGYPDSKEEWLGTMSVLQRMRICNFLTDWKFPKETDGEETKRFRPDEQTPESLRSPQAVVDYWVQRIMGRSLPADEYEPIVDFLALGRNWTQDMPAEDLTDRLPYTIALILMSPTFMLR